MMSVTRKTCHIYHHTLPLYDLSFIYFKLHVICDSIKTSLSFYKLHVFHNKLFPTTKPMPSAGWQAAVTYSFSKIPTGHSSVKYARQFVKLTSLSIPREYPTFIFATPNLKNVATWNKYHYRLDYSLCVSCRVDVKRRSPARCDKLN